MADAGKRGEDGGYVPIPVTGTVPAAPLSPPSPRPRGRITVHYIVAILVALQGPLAFGYAIMALNNTKDVISAYLGNPERLVWSAIVTMFAVGGMVGSFIATFIANRFGRRAFFMGNSVFFLGGALLQAMAHSTVDMAIGRFIYGFGAGGATAVVPMYLAEIALTRQRGLVGSLNQVSTVVAILLAAILGASWALGTADRWRWVLWISGIPGAISLVCGPFLTESPKWLLFMKRDEEAMNALLRLRDEAEDVASEVSTILQSPSIGDLEEANKIASETEDDSFKKLFTSPLLRRPLMVVLGLMVLQQFSGVNGIMFYSKSFFQNAGVKDAALATILSAAINAAATILALPVINRFGRKPLMLLSMGGMIASMILLTIFLQFTGQIYQYIAIGAVLVYLAFFELALGPLAWIYAGEVFPTNQRANAGSAGAAVNWIGTITISESFTSLQAALGSWTFVPFTAILMVGYVFLVQFMVEPKGKDIEDVLKEFNKHQIQMKSKRRYGSIEDRRVADANVNVKITPYQRGKFYPEA